jgi:hypothetical protein
MGPFADPVGITIGHETTFENGLDQVTECVMDYPIPERGGADQPPFGVMDVETRIVLWLVTAFPQFTAQHHQIVFQPVFKGGDFGAAAFASAGASESQEQVLPAGDLI